MNDLRQLAEIDWWQVILAIILFLVCLKFVWSLIDWLIFDKLGIETKKMKQKREEHTTLMNTVKKVDVLESKDDAIQKNVDNILILLKDHIETDKKNTRATFRSSLYRMHSDFTSRGFITKEGLKTFLECGAAYELADGDDIYHDKLKPEIMKLPIKEVDNEGVLIEDI